MGNELSKIDLKCSFEYTNKFHQLNGDEMNIFSLPALFGPSLLRTHFISCYPDDFNLNCGRKSLQKYSVFKL